MLRFIMNTWLTTPSNNEYRRNCIDFITQQRSQWINDVPLSTILHINDGNFAGSKMISGTKCSTVTFISGNQMMFRIYPVCMYQIIT